MSVDVSSKILSSIMAQKVLDVHEIETQSCFRPNRGTHYGIFSVRMALQKRKEHGLATYVLFNDMVKAFDKVSREALFIILGRFGLFDYLINIHIHLHFDAKLKMKVGDIEPWIASNNGIRQGPCEGPLPFSFVMQAVMETIEWPEDIIKLKFMACICNEHGRVRGVDISRSQWVYSFDIRYFLYVTMLLLSYLNLVVIKKKSV
jgi:hypothetical protein